VWPSKSMTRLAGTSRWRKASGKAIHYPPCYLI
jgi:hypothetical protein